MVLPHITPRRAAPYLLQGAYGAHIVARMWRLSKQPPSTKPLYLFLLRQTDIVVVLISMPVVWLIVQRRQQRRVSDRPIDKVIGQPAQDTAHQLRQVFTALLLGLGLLRRRIARQQVGNALDMVERLQHVIAEGIQAVDRFDPPADVSRNGSDLELEW
jgi:hypothetical protein